MPPMSQSKHKGVDMDRILRGLLGLLAMCGVLSAVPAVAEELTGTQVISIQAQERQRCAI